jgi:hypothetical protein
MQFIFSLLSLTFFFTSSFLHFAPLFVSILAVYLDFILLPIWSVSLVREQSKKPLRLYVLRCRGIITAPSHAKLKVRYPPPTALLRMRGGTYMLTHVHLFVLPTVNRPYKLNIHTVLYCPPFCCSPKKWMTTMRQFFDPFGNQTLGTSIKRSCIIPLDHRRTSRSRLWRENRSWRKNPGELFRNKKDIKKDTKTERSLGLHIISELLVSPLTHYHTILCHDQGL